MDRLVDFFFFFSPIVQRREVIGHYIGARNARIEYFRAENLFDV